MTRAPVRFLAAGAAAFLLGVPGVPAATITGDYLEARTADVWTGPCFANGEVNLAGKEAILAWRVSGGTWQDVGLAGLSVVAVVRAHATLGDPHGEPQPVRTVLLVDERATGRQREALVDLAGELGGSLARNVLRVDTVPIRIQIEGDGHATLTAGEIAELRTRCFHAADRHCGNEAVYYPPLTEVAGAHPAHAVANAYRGKGLGGTWSSPDKRSAFIATFER